MNRNPQSSEKKDTSQSDDDKLDKALEDSFPASDPPAQTEASSKVGGKQEVPGHSPHHR